MPLSNSIIDEYALRWPVDTGTDVLSKVSIKHFLYSDWFAAKDSVFSFDEHGDPYLSNSGKLKLAELATGKAAEVLRQLMLPDLNSIVELSYDLILPNAKKWDSYYFGLDRLDLILPIVVEGVEVNSVVLKMPSVDTAVKMDNYTTKKAKTEFLVRVCTGLDSIAYSKLSAIDGARLNAKINDFLLQTADFFPEETSTQ